MANIVVKNESIIRYNDALSQKGLDALESRVFSDKVQCEGVGGMRFFHVRGITSFWGKDDAPAVYAMMEQVISGIAANNVIFALILSGDSNGVQLRIGVSDYAEDAARNILRAVYKGAELTDCDTGS